MKSNEKCRGSGLIFGGYRDDLEGETLRIRCTNCWRKVDVIPIAPEVRTDLRKDRSPVTIIRKQVVDHKFGSLCAMHWRRDKYNWLNLAFFIFWIGGMVYVFSR